MQDINATEQLHPQGFLGIFQTSGKSTQKALGTRLDNSAAHAAIILKVGTLPYCFDPLLVEYTTNVFAET